MTSLPPSDDSVPSLEVLDTIEKYRTHVADSIKRSTELASEFKRKGDRFAAASILLAFGASAVGFVTAAVDVALLGVIAGVLSAAGGALSSWIQRSRYDAMRAANLSYQRDLQRELRQFDARSGPYKALPDVSDIVNAEIRYETFVERCEEISLQRQDEPGAPTSR